MKRHTSIIKQSPTVVCVSIFDQVRLLRAETENLKIENAELKMKTQVRPTDPDVQGRCR
jgi:hypothetical protein